MMAPKANRPCRLAGKLLMAFLAALLWFGQPAYAQYFPGMPFVQNGAEDQGGFREGKYDKNSPQPTAYIWVRQSMFKFPESNDLHYVIRFPKMRPNEAVTHFAIGPDNTVYFTAGGKLIVIPQGNPASHMVLSWQDELLSSPVIGEDGMLYIGSKRKVAAFDSTQISSENPLIAKWIFAIDDDSDWFYQPVALSGDGTIYAAGSAGSLYAINPDGSLKWKFKGTNRPMLTPVIVDDVDDGENVYLFVVENVSPSQAYLYVLRDDEEEAAKIEAHDLEGTAEVPLISREATGLMLWVPPRAERCTESSSMNFSLMETTTRRTFSIRFPAAMLPRCLIRPSETT